MFDWLKKHFEKENPATTPKTKPVILTIHGYGRRRKHEFDNLALWGKKDGYDIVQFDMYDLFDEEDHDWMCWVQRAKDQLDQYKKTNRDIYLVGFSMGGVIASYLAAMVPVKKLVLLAPAFSYINTVSYTHLDVYKRQVLWYVHIPFDCMYHIVAPVSAVQLLKKNTAIMIHCNIPVSYTHLDVYKRQPFIPIVRA